MDCTLDRYTDYLLATPKWATATGMSKLFDGKISHDNVTRFLSSSYFDSATVWSKAKPLVRQYESLSDGVLIADDTIIEKAHTDENAMISWHWDHSLSRMVKGVNLLSLLYHSGELSVPISIHLVEKTEGFIDKKTGQTKYKSPVTKNEITRQMLQATAAQRVKWRYFLADSWFSSAETMNVINDSSKKHYIMAVECSREVALSYEDKLQGRFHRVDAIDWSENVSPRRVWLRSVKHDVLLVRQVFIHEDASQGILYLVSNDTTLDVQTMTTTYQKRWEVEQYHKSLKQHTAIAASPTKTIETQANHFVAAIVAYIKFETIKLKNGINHFAIKSTLLAAATKAAFLALKHFSA
jgi:hypothetical protein